MLGIPGRNCKAAYKSALSWAGPSSLSAFPAWRTAGRELYGGGHGGGACDSDPALPLFWIRGKFLTSLGLAAIISIFPSLVPLLEHMSAVFCFLYLENLVFLSRHCDHTGN